MRAAPCLNLSVAHIAWIAKRCVAAWPAVGTPAAAASPGTISVVGAGATAGITRNRLADDTLPHLCVGLEGQYWRGQRQKTDRE